MTELPKLPNPAFWASTPSQRGETTALTVRWVKKAFPVYRDSTGYLWAAGLPGGPILDQDKIRAAVNAGRRNFKI